MTKESDIMEEQLRCKNCNEELKAHWKKCPECDFPVGLAKCRKCNEELKASWKDCPACQTPVESRETGASPEAGNDGKSPAEEALRQAQECHDKKDYENALRFANDAIRLDPSNADYHSIQGIVYEHLERYNEAVASLSAAIKLDSSNPDYYTTRGRSLIKRGIIANDESFHMEMAIADFKNALMRDPSHENAQELKKICEEALAEMQV